jgi:hypothetical protein
MGYHKLDELQTAPDHTSLRVILRDSARARTNCSHRRISGPYLLDDSLVAPTGISYRYHSRNLSEKLLDLLVAEKLSSGIVEGRRRRLTPPRPLETTRQLRTRFTSLGSLWVR